MTAQTQKTPEVTQYKKRSQLKTIALRFSRNKLAMTGLIILVLLVIVILTLDLYIDYDAQVVTQNMSERLQTPNWQHLLGTDQYGRDILARILYGARFSLGASMIVVILATFLSIAIASVSAYFGGIVDDIIMRITDIFYALPFYLMAICVVAAMGTGIISLCVANIVGAVPSAIRIARSYMLPLKNQEYVEAAVACGTSKLRILYRHIIPNAVGPIIVQATMDLSSTLLAISSLSYIGLGVSSPTPEWGLMLSEGTQQMFAHPHLVLIPGFTLVIVAMAANLLGDGLRDALDPKLKN